MGDFIDVAAFDDLADGAMKKIKAGGRDVLLARVGDIVYAAADRCPHLGGSLSLGRLNGTVVICPSHGARFDLADGRTLHWAGRDQDPPKNAKPFQLFEVKVEGGRVLVSVA